MSPETARDETPLDIQLHAFLELGEACEDISRLVADAYAETLRRIVRRTMGDGPEADQALADDTEDMLVAGQTRLIGLQDLSNLDRLRELFEAFSRKREILRVLERTLRAQGVRIFIGEETGMAPLDGVSLVTAPYGAGGRTLGVLGVIGPTRMAYERVIPVVQAAAAVLSEALGQDDER